MERFILIGLIHLVYYGESEVIISDTIAQYENKTINCNQTEDCIIRCATERSCKSTIINCPDNFRCDIRCESDYSCPLLTINHSPNATTQPTLTCLGFFSCYQLNFPIPNPNLPLDIICDGYNACRNANILCPTHADCNIVCRGAQSCSNTNPICPIDKDCNIGCYGVESCRNSTMDCGEYGNCNIDCCGQAACESLKFKCPTHGGSCNFMCDGAFTCNKMAVHCSEHASCNVECDGSFACSDSLFKWPSTPGLGILTCAHTNNGALATCNNVKFPVPDPDIPLVVNCYDLGSCENSHIICPQNADCKILCGAYGCKHANITCPKNTINGKSAGCIIECQEANACLGTSVDWGGTCNLLVCKSMSACRGVTLPSNMTKKCDESIETLLETVVTTFEPLNKNKINEYGYIIDFKDIYVLWITICLLLLINSIYCLYLHKHIKTIKSFK